MIDQNSQFFAILTAVGEAKQANADALGIPWTFSQMGIGDANGTDPVPDRLQTKLINEWRRAPLNQLKPDPANPSIIVAELVIPAEVGGKWIREVGLYDSSGDLVAVANCPPSYKPLLAQGSGRTQTVRMNLIVSGTANVELKIDPSVVLATRAFVDQRIVEEINKLDAKQSVRVATVAAITLAGVQTIDGVSVIVGDRVLVKNQFDAKDNGIYSVVAGGSWARVADADSNLEVTPSLMVSVEQGATQADTLWQLTTDAPIVLSTTPLTFERVAGPNGVVPGTYRQVTVDRRGLVIAGGNPTTLSGYGITDAYSKAEVDSRTAQFQTKLGYTPVQQGTGVGQSGNPIKIGWSGTHIKATVDSQDMGNLWYSGNFDPNGKANWGSTLAAYGITDAYTKAEADLRDSQRPLSDSISYVGLSGGVLGQPYMRRASNSDICWLQTKLEFNPVQQGTGIGQLQNVVKIGWSDNGLKVTVDASDQGRMWYASNFDPNSKANWGSTLAAYGIVDAFSKTEVNQLVSTRAAADSISAVGFAGNNADLPYMRRASDDTVYYLQRRLGFTPTEQGGGPNMTSNKLRIGYNGAGSLRVQVDTTDIGDLISDNNLSAKLAALGLSAIGQYAFARVLNGIGSINQGALVPGTNLIYSSTSGSDGASNQTGLINVGTWRVHGAFTSGERTLFQRVS
jgi:hypothetical protein